MWDVYNKKKDNEMLIVRKGIFEQKIKQDRGEERGKELAYKVIKKIEDSR